MGAVGVICEYNPFHNGHALQLRLAREAAGAQALVCVMSGHFTQRGEAALLSPGVRAAMALAHGADVVLELPTLWATGHAQRFALGGVGILHALGVEALSFGSETADLQGLAAAAQALEEESPPFAAALHRAMDEGLAFPRARARALDEASGLALADAPNTALAIAYLRAIQALESGMAVYPILRQGAGYHDAELGPLASATAIRQGVWRGEWAQVGQAMPADAFAALQTAVAAGQAHVPGALDVALLARLRTAAPDALASLADNSEGLHLRLHAMALKAAGREDLLGLLKCKRYPWARLSRMLCYGLLDITQPLVDAYPLPPYARLLGFRGSARSLIAGWRKGSLPVITHAADPRLRDSPVFHLDVRAADLWALGCSAPEARKGRQLFSQKPVIMS